MKKLEKTVESGAVIFLFAMLICCTLQVVFRYILKASFSFPDEFARMFYIWMVFLMLPVLESRNEQIKVVFFFDKFPYRFRVVLYWAITVLYTVVLAILCYGSWTMMLTSTTVMFSSTPWLIMSFQYIPLIIGSVFGLTFVIYRAFRIKQVMKEAEDEYTV